MLNLVAAPHELDQVFELENLRIKILILKKKKLIKIKILLNFFFLNNNFNYY